jgi:hypothetical protein
MIFRGIMLALSSLYSVGVHQNHFELQICTNFQTSISGFPELAWLFSVGHCHRQVINVISAF